MPQGGLGLLPLHAAWREVDGVKRAFLDDYTVTYAPSGYALSVSRQRLREDQRRGKSLLAMINPTRDLDFAAQEGETIASLFAKDQVLLLGGSGEDEATAAAFRAGVPGRAYVHYSGHGFYNWAEFLRSGLLMARGDPLYPERYHHASGPGCMPVGDPLGL